ncbi:hypothetical protein BKA25_000901 [Actinoalloteichus hymeniacidonis]|nr:hypothetical protein [Actinoalloteichus hymeniacidonis]
MSALTGVEPAQTGGPDEPESVEAARWVSRSV